MDSQHSTHAARIGYSRWRRHGAYALVAALCVFVLGCEARNSGEEDQVTSDGSASQAAASQFADVVNSENTGTGYAWLLPHPPRPSLVARAIEAVSPIRTAYAAAGYSCGTNLPTWTPGLPGTFAFTPATPCTLTYGSGATATVNWSGSWDLAFTGSLCGGASNGLIGSTAPCSVSRTTSGIQRSVMFPSHVYTTTWNTQGASGYAQALSGPDDGQCVGSCPPSVPSTSGQRSFTISGTHVQYQIDGMLFRDHTVSTAAPIVVAGSGNSRTVQSGTVQMQHNLAHFTTVTSVLTALTHSTACPYPTGGSLRTTFSGTKYDGQVETIGFGPNCGDATITLSDGSAKPVRLTN